MQRATLKLFKLCNRIRRQVNKTVNILPHAKKQRQTPGFLVWQRGQGNFELATNCDYIHLGRLTQAKVSVSVGFQSLP